MTTKPNAPKDRSNSAHHVSNLERGLDVMEFLLKHPEGQGISEIARALGVSKNIVFRVTSTLVDRGYLHRDDETKRLTLSRKLLSIGYSVEAESGLLESSLGIMRQLRDVVKETVIISVMLDREGMVLESVPGLHRFRFVVETGMRFPIHGSAATKVILAVMPEKKAMEVLDHIELTRFTPRTLTTKKAFREEFKRIRACGYAVDHQETYDGIHCIAAPVLNDRGEPVASITVTGPSSRLTERMLDELGPVVREHTDRISQRLGFVGTTTKSPTTR